MKKDGFHPFKSQGFFWVVWDFCPPSFFWFLSLLEQFPWCFTTAKSGVRDDGINPLDELGGLFFFSDVDREQDWGVFVAAVISFSGILRVKYDQKTYIGACLTPVTVFVNPIGIQSPSQMMVGVYSRLYNHLLRKVFRFHYLSQFRWLDPYGNNPFISPKTPFSVRGSSSI